MAKFHINNRGEVKPCQAKVRCRFGGASGQENHFTSQEAAAAALQRNYGTKYGVSPTALRKTSLPSLQDLAARGVPVNHVTSVRSHTFPPSQGVSTVDILDESMTPGFMEDLRGGNLHPF